MEGRFDKKTLFDLSVFYTLQADAQENTLLPGQALRNYMTWTSFNSLEFSEREKKNPKKSNVIVVAL